MPSSSRDLVFDDLNHSDPLPSTGGWGTSCDGRLSARIYAFLFRCYALFFWLSMLIGSTHGMILKGPILFWNEVKPDPRCGIPEWGVFFLIVFLLGFYEGSRAFQKGFSPMLVFRTWELSLSRDPVLMEILETFFSTTSQRIQETDESRLQNNLTLNSIQPIIPLSDELNSTYPG